jgi:hypothetical protein
MRWLVVLLVAGCTDGVAPPNFTNDDQGVGDLGEEDLAVPVDGGAEDLLPPPDLLPPSTDLPPDLRPQSCTTACDCPSGQSCTLGTCVTMPMIFCCGTPGCTTGSNICETSDGRFSQCSAPADAGVRPDAGPTGTCATVACTPGTGSNLFCRIACGNLTATCSGATGHCAP